MNDYDHNTELKQDSWVFSNPIIWLIQFPFKYQVITIEELNKLRTAIYIDNSSSVTSFLILLGDWLHITQIFLKQVEFSVLQQHFVRTVYF